METKSKTIKKWLIRTLSLVIILLSTFSMNAFAGTSTSSFNVDVPKFGGTCLSDTRQTKTFRNRSGEIAFSLVGGGYKISCRLIDMEDNSEGAWVNKMKTGSSASLPSRASHKAGHKMKVKFKNKVTTVVDVNAIGDWRSDITN